eukprot:scpid106145/ scgid6371/ 
MAQQQQQAQQPQAQAAPAPAPAAPAQRAPVPRQWATPEKFNGGVQDRWESWWLQFEQLALVNAWTPQETVQFLPLALKGEALLYYHSLPQGTRQGQLAPLAQALQARFAPPQRGDLHCAEFQARRQRQKESLGEYCEAVKEAARLAYPNM